MQYDAVIFDLYGTLIDWFRQEEYEDNFRKMASMLDVPHAAFVDSWLDNARDRNMGRHGSLEGDIKDACLRIGYQPTPDQISEALRVRLEIIRRNHEPRIDAVSTLTKLRAANLKLGLLSDATYDSVVIWDETPFARLMDAVVFSCEMGCCKPDNRMYARICNLLDVAPNKCLYIGDGASNELTGARSFGMHPVLIRVGYDSYFDKWRADAENWTGTVISNLTEVLGLCF